VKLWLTRQSYPQFHQPKKTSKNRQHPGLAGKIIYPNKHLKSKELPMWKSIVKKQMRYYRNHDIAKKVNLFFEADKLKNIELACKRLGYKRSYYYYWWNCLKQAGWKISALLV
jgi:hypothetical protein